MLFLLFSIILHACVGDSPISFYTCVYSHWALPKLGAEHLQALADAKHLLPGHYFSTVIR